MGKQQQPDGRAALLPTDTEDVLYGAQTLLCLENLSCSPYKMSDFPQFIRALAVVKQAAARANVAAGAMEPSIGQAIIEACNQVASGNYDRHFPVDMLHGGGSIAFNQNMNEVLAALANNLIDGTRKHESRVLPRQHVNLSQSTADSCATAFRLALLLLSEPLIETVLRACEVLESKASSFSQITTVARTCLQDAMPAPASALLSGWASLLRRRAARLVDASYALHSINLGGTVIGTGDGACRSYRQSVVAHLVQGSGRPFKLRDNLFDAAQNSDDIAELASTLSLLAESLIKICSDLRLLCSGPHNGLQEMSIPYVQEGSSFFAQKNNPVVPETVLQACFHVVGNQRAAQAAMEHAELHLNVFESGAFFHTADSMRILNAALILFNERCLSGLHVNEQRCAEMVTKHLSKGTHVK